MKKENVKLVVTSIISIVVSSIISVSAAGNLFNSSEVVYDNSNSNLNSTNVQDAVDELYAAATDYSNIDSRVSAIETQNANYFRNSAHTYLDGRRVVVGEDYSNAGGYVDFYYNNTNVGYLTSNTGDIILSALNGKKLKLTGSEVQINGTNIIDLIYPVGSIYISVTDSTKSAVESRFPGTKWDAFASGRTLVGVNTSDADFNTVQKQGGSKTHNHKYGFSYQSWWNAVSLEGNPKAGLLNYASNGTYSISSWSSPGTFENTVNASATRGAQTVSMSQYVTEAYTSTSTSLQPYMTVYMYKRTS